MSEETGTKILTDEERRENLRERIEAAETRNEERSLGDYAREATDTATEFVKEHPITAIAGVAAIGLAIGAMTRPGRRLGRRAGAIATYASEMGLAYASGLLDQAGDLARAGGDKIEDFGDDIAHSARSAKRNAAFFANSKSDDARYASRKMGRRASRSYRNAKARIAH